MVLRSKYALIGVLVALVAGGFLWKYGDSTGPVDSDTSDGARIVGGWQQADFALPEISGTLPGVQGVPDGLPTEGTYLVNLWASYCGPCREEMPWLERLHVDAEVPVVGVTRDNLLPEAEKAIRRRGVTYPNLRDEYGDFMVALSDVVPPQQLPSSFLVEDGRITWTHVGPFTSYADLRDSVLSRM